MIFYVYKESKLIKWGYITVTLDIKLVKLYVNAWYIPQMTLIYPVMGMK